MLAELEDEVERELTRTIKEWRHLPYQQDGTAVPACFPVTFRVKHGSELGLLLSSSR